MGRQPPRLSRAGQAQRHSGHATSGRPAPPTIRWIRSRPDLLRRPTQLTQSANAERVIPLGQPHPSLVPHKMAVIILRHRQPQSPEQKSLPCRRLQQIRPAHHFCDLHRSIVHHHRKLISRNIIAAPNHEVSKVAPRHKPLRPEMQVVKTNLLPIGNPKPPIHSGRLGPLAKSKASRPGDESPTRPRIQRFIIPLVRRPRRLSHILPRTSARINQLALAQLFPSFQIKSAPVALRIRTDRPATIGPLAPLDSQPPQVFEHRPDKLIPAALEIQIFATQDQGAAGNRRALRRDPESARVSEMEQSGRRGSKPPAVGMGRIGQERFCHGTNAIASSSRSAIEPDAVCSICRTRPGVSARDFEDAWINRGLISITPPFRTRQSNGFAHGDISCTLSSLSTPASVRGRKNTKRSVRRRRVVELDPQSRGPGARLMTVRVHNGFPSSPAMAPNPAVRLEPLVAMRCPDAIPRANMTAAIGRTKSHEREMRPEPKLRARSRASSGC